jgi:hypothetical protein
MVFQKASTEPSKCAAIIQRRMTAGGQLSMRMSGTRVRRM